MNTLLWNMLLSWVVLTVIVSMLVAAFRYVMRLHVFLRNEDKDDVGDDD